MKVILLKDVRNVGRKDEVKNVADGYATNVLLRQNWAVMASPERVAALEKRQADIASEADRMDIALDDKIRSLVGTRIEITARATPKGGLFKSVTSADIATATHLPENAIDLEHPIKTAGEHAVRMHSKNTEGELTVVIVTA